MEAEEMIYLAKGYRESLNLEKGVVSNYASEDPDPCSITG